MTTFITCFVGDSITLGTGDDDYLGWPARISTDARSCGHSLTIYNLGVRAETTAQIRQRWRRETALRLPDHLPGHLVFNFGTNDTRMVNDKVEVPLHQSASNARAMIEEALAWGKPTLWIGQIPVDETNQPLDSIMGITFWFSNKRIKQTNEVFKDIADDLGVPFLDLFSVLHGDSVWEREHKQGDSVHPTTEGYAIIAELIGQWDAWRAWLA